MNNIRIPTYKKLAICFLVLAICFLVLLSIIYLNFYGTHTELVDSYSVNDTLRMYKNDDIRMYNFDCITDTIVEVITTCNTYTLLTVHLL